MMDDKLIMNSYTKFEQLIALIADRGWYTLADKEELIQLRSEQLKNKTDYKSSVGVYPQYAIIQFLKNYTCIEDCYATIPEAFKKENRKIIYIPKTLRPREVIYDSGDLKIMKYTDTKDISGLAYLKLDNMGIHIKDPSIGSIRPDINFDSEKPKKDKVSNISDVKQFKKDLEENSPWIFDRIKHWIVERINDYIYSVCVRYDL